MLQVGKQIVQVCKACEIWEERDGHPSKPVTHPTRKSGVSLPWRYRRYLLLPWPKNLDTHHSKGVIYRPKDKIVISLSSPSTTTRSWLFAHSPNIFFTCSHPFIPLVTMTNSFGFHFSLSSLSLLHIDFC
ncbi:hypothetical protein L1887_01587 [Cichorium endivia]|nr:hypothetical protein L1887_01587 [Cichorium endivia]